MSVDPKRTAELVALMEKALGLTPKPKPKPKPRAVVNEGQVVRDADVQVSPADPNYRRSDEGVVRVRRKDFVTVNMALYEQQQELKREDRLRIREIDPFRLGHWDEPE
ncbi:MAG: hypothetical protein C5B60_02015 [Chloroflexi bacterium]|nr:MAG: hypothetical protein C5B60_02015 [Chloroflexota bacterium]